MRPPYYLTAYGIACKHGFQGSEEEWLNSLTAFYLAQQAGYKGTADEWLSLLNDPVPDIAIGEVTTLDGGSDAIVTISGDRLHPVLNFGIPRGLGMVDALALVGGTMQGNIHMNGHGITGLAEPDGEKDAVNKKYADAIKKTAEDALPKAGGEMAGQINMKGYQIKNLPNPSEDGDPVPKRVAILSTGGKMTGALEVVDPKNENDAVPKKYAEQKKLPFYNVAIPAASFVADTTYAGYPYRAAVALSGVMESMIPEVVFSLADAVSGNFAPVAACYNGGVYIYAAEVPEADMTVPTILCWRGE